MPDQLELSATARKFILHWGEMGTRWGINRTVAQIDALLFLSPEPLTAEAIAETLSVARSNVSSSLKELQSWRLIKMVHVIGDRRDYFESLKDVWEMFRVVLDGRKRREIDPTLAVLRESVQELEKGEKAEAYTKKKLSEMLNFFETASAMYEEMRRLPTDALIKFAKLGSKIKKILGY